MQLSCIYIVQYMHITMHHVSVTMGVYFGSFMLLKPQKKTEINKRPMMYSSAMFESEICIYMDYNVQWYSVKRVYTFSSEVCT